MLGNWILDSCFQSQVKNDQSAWLSNANKAPPSIMHFFLTTQVHALGLIAKMYNNTLSMTLCLQDVNCIAQLLNIH
jgi:hypothetical protein